MLIDVLSSRQKDLRWSHTKMAAELGISYQMWINALVRRTSTPAILKGAASRFPDLGDVVLSELRGERVAISQ